MKLYEGVVWPSGDLDAVGIRVSLWAEDDESAGRSVRSEYGEDAVYSIRNEEDARRVR